MSHTEESVPRGSRQHTDSYEQSPAMLLTVEPFTRKIISCNETLIKVLNCIDKSAVIHADLLDIYHPDCRKELKCALEQLSETGVAIDIELFLQVSGAKKLPVLVDIHCVQSEQANILYSISNRLQETSRQEREHIKKHMRSGQQLFSQNKEQYEVLLDALTDGWWDYDLEKDEEYLSEGLKKSLGYTDEEMPNFLGYWKRNIFPEDLELSLANLEQHVASGGEKPYIQEVRYRHKDGHTVWVICRGKALKDKDGKLSRMFGTHTDITALKEAEAKLRARSLVDSLTQLPNRAHFTLELFKSLARARRTGASVAVLFIDLDNFKPINDKCGHGVGDVFLQDIANRLQEVTRASDTLARLGGDEFGVILESVTSLKIVEDIAMRYTRSFPDEFQIAVGKVFCTISVGIAVSPNDGDTVDELINHADMAMYKVKKAGGNGFRFYNSSVVEPAESTV